MARRGVKVEGKTDVLFRLNRLRTNTGDAAVESTRSAARLGRDRAVRRTPFETGNLRQSYHITSERRLSGAITALANVAAYAAVVHENVEEKLRGVPRPGNRPGRYWNFGESKFLEKAVYGDTNGLFAEAAETARRALFRGI